MPSACDVPPPAERVRAVTLAPGSGQKRGFRGRSFAFQGSSGTRRFFGSTCPSRKKRETSCFFPVKCSDFQWFVAPCTGTRVAYSPGDVTSTRYQEKPYIAIWETTQACDLACLHCRACAQPERDAEELSTDEGFALLDSFAKARVPLVVLTGGDPAKRPDLVELVAHGRKVGLGMGLTPSTTPLVTTQLIERLARAGLSRLAVSIDGPDAECHDAFRGVEGSFEQSLRILDDASSHSIPTQINTSIHAGNIERLDEMSRIVANAGSVLWSVFFLVPTGRADADMLPTPEATEKALEQLSVLAERASFAIKTTAAPHYRRVLMERKLGEGAAAQHGVHGSRAVRINDGRGFMFVSHKGEIFPSGFLPIDCGNVRKDDVMDVYREHPLFVRLRDPDQLVGKCGDCEYRALCGGSRARAYALLGDPMESDPLCAFEPPEPDDVPSRRALSRRRLATANA